MMTTIFITLLGAGSILSRSAIRQDWLLHKFLPNELTEGFEAQDFGENLEQFSLKKRDGKPMELGADHRHGAEYDYLNQFAAFGNDCQMALFFEKAKSIRNKNKSRNYVF